ncbi:hypothetical protein DA803_01445 [[Mycoplasma] phocae]|uniref:Lipoprotein n=1 Tax=[Mycoplasma] phocae TaxID=142651 RepID=A0A2Z5IPU7_9BACT|nr:hypothetical protein [[Mycoplasma] phocae]AXE60749.1 hypothetical protein DA803_01445 [[Mycoplasma] phocae]
MKKNTRLTISLVSLSSLFALPLIVASCTNEKKKDDKRDISEEIFEEHLAIKLSKIAHNQTETDADEVSDALVKAKDWDEVKSLFKKYGITYKETEEMPDGATFAVNKSTHPHEDEGLIHLDIDRTVKGVVAHARFEIRGFKIVAIEDSYTFGNWKLETKSKITAPITTVKNEILAAQKKGFDELIKALQKYVKVEQIDTNDKESEFKFDESDVEEVSDSGQLHFEKVFTYQKSSPDKTTPAPTHFVITGLEKS